MPPSSNITATNPEPKQTYTIYKLMRNKTERQILFAFQRCVQLVLDVETVHIASSA